jgi:hypothetical protein
MGELSEDEAELVHCTVIMYPQMPIHRLGLQGLPREVACASMSFLPDAALMLLKHGCPALALKLKLGA